MQTQNQAQAVPMPHLPDAPADPQSEPLMPVADAHYFYHTAFTCDLRTCASYPDEVRYSSNHRKRTPRCQSGIRDLDLL